jgi:hypothetical protein
MAYEIEQIVGPAKRADGLGEGPTRVGITSEAIVGDAHGRYYEAVSRGVVFGASMQAGASLGTALTATAVTLTLYNPIGSKVNLAILEVALVLTTMLAAPGAPAASTAVYVLAANLNSLAAAPSAVTAATVRNELLGGVAGVGLAYTAATLPAAPVIIRPLFGVSYSEITAASIAQLATQFIDPTDAKVILAPNTAITLQAVGAATSGIVSMMWEEVPF